MEVLFVKGELDASLRATLEKLLAEVQGWDPDQLLVQSESEIAAYLVERHTASCPVLRRDDMYVSEPADVTQRVHGYSGREIAVPATRLTVHVPYDGERILFFLRPSSFTWNPPQADVTETELVLNSRIASSTASASANRSTASSARSNAG